MSTVVPTAIIDKNGKHTTVSKKTGDAPKPSARPIPKPIARSVAVPSSDQRNKDAVRDLLARLSLPFSEKVNDSEVKELQRNVYAVNLGGHNIVAFDTVQVGDEVISGVVTKEAGKITGKLYRGDGTSTIIGSDGYALPSTSAAIETQLDAAKIASAHL